MVMLSLPVILLGIIVIEQLVVIIMLIVMNCKIKKEKMPTPAPMQNNYAQVVQTPVPQTGAYTKGIMICRKCYRPVQLPNKFCSCCGQSLIMR